MSSQTLTNENLSETFVREQHGDVPSVDVHNGSYSASMLLNTPSVPGRMSPVLSEDPTMKLLNADYSGSSNYKNTTIQANVANVQIGYIKENHSPMDNGETPDHTTYHGHPVVENADQERQSTRNRRTGSESRQMKFKFEERCRSCEAHVAENNRLNLKLAKAKKKKQAWEQRCENAEKQFDDKKKECEELQKQLCESQCQGAVDFWNSQRNVIHVTNQQIATMQSNIISLEMKKARVEEQLAELKQQSENMEENYHRARDERDAFVEKIMLHKATIADHELEQKNMEETHRRERVEETNAFMTKMNDLKEEKNSLEEKITELEQKCENYEDCTEQMMADITTLAHYENFQLVSRLRLEKVNERLLTQQETMRTQTNNLRTSNELLQRVVSELVTRVQSFEGRQQDAQALRDELRRTIEGLRFPQQLRQPDNHENLQFPFEPVDILALYFEVIPEADVLVPD